MKKAIRGQLSVFSPSEHKIATVPNPCGGGGGGARQSPSKDAGHEEKEGEKPSQDGGCQKAHPF